jgi:hypothetical protein
MMAFEEIPWVMSHVMYPDDIIIDSAYLSAVRIANNLRVSDLRHRPI